MLKLSRRSLLIASGLQLLWPSSLVFSDVQTPKKNDSIEQTLAAFLDVLLPQDAYSPSASQLKIDQELLTNVETNPALKSLIQRGCKWLNQQAKGSFSALPDEYKLQLVAWMAEKASPSKLPSLFFLHTRYHAVALYYSKEAAYQSVGLPHPPQPQGYPELLSRSRNG